MLRMSTAKVIGIASVLSMIWAGNGAADDAAPTRQGDKSCQNELPRLCQFIYWRVEPYNADFAYQRLFDSRSNIQMFD